MWRFAKGDKGSIRFSCSPGDSGRLLVEPGIVRFKLHGLDNDYPARGLAISCTVRAGGAALQFVDVDYGNFKRDSFARNQARNVACLGALCLDLNRRYLFASVIRA